MTEDLLNPPKKKFCSFRKSYNSPLKNFNFFVVYQPKKLSFLWLQKKFFNWIFCFLLFGILPTLLLYFTNIYPSKISNNNKSKIILFALTKIQNSFWTPLISKLQTKQVFFTILIIAYRYTVLTINISYEKKKKQTTLRINTENFPLYSFCFVFFSTVFGLLKCHK